VSRLIKGFEQMRSMMKGLSGAGGRRRLAQELLKTPRGRTPLIGG
jgi:signal recognition particle GTPase